MSADKGGRGVDGGLVPLMSSEARFDGRAGGADGQRYDDVTLALSAS